MTSQTSHSGRMDDLRGARYWEIFLIRSEEGQLTAAIYNTTGLNDCPAELWRSLDPGQLAKDFGVLAVVLNGPWGSGKTRFIKRNLGLFVRERPGEVKQEPLYVSLYGVSATASRAGMVRRSAEVGCAARTSLEALGQGHGEPPAHGGD